ncbi:MAG TPA: isoprenylcysteine carboxylmethyltransferase family protein [Candidatus Margulisiibacteriota bacterium]|nr:isoprenylcysteine carboxylmethyltransferase family protein [Candidatus Margulisiibacteriota bacterium]
MTANRSLLWPTIGTVLFVLSVPGTVVVYIPYTLCRWHVGPPVLGIALTRWLGALLILCALPIFFDFVQRFVREGEGTPAPVAPTVRLVVGGAFRYVRNPGYVAVVSLLVGQALLFASVAVLLYALVVGLAFHAFVMLYEEPTLRRQFGAEYEAYCRKVPRWLPRLRSSD